MNLKVAVVGATGLVGRKMLEVLRERKFPVGELIPVASEKSVGRRVEFCGVEIPVCSVEGALAKKPDIALFSAGGDASLKYAPMFEEIGCRVVDNSSAWRMSRKLIIPEINGEIIGKDDMIIANPNCSTIQMLLAIAPIHRKYGISRIVVSTYQSITGTGVKAINQLENERNGLIGEMAYNYNIDKNCIPQCDVFTDNSYTKEEMKLVNETHKILDENIRVTATAVRIPVMGGHSESVNLELNSVFELEDIKRILSETEGVIVEDDIAENKYPMPLNAEGKDEVFVGRIRRDFSNENSLNMWVVADNLRKGAATNTVQIAELLLKKVF